MWRELTARPRAVLLATLCALGLGLGGSEPEAAAFEVRSDEVVVVPSGTVVHDDLLVAARTIAIAGEVEGDVFALGATLTVSGTIRGDLIAAAQQIAVDGAVGGDVRAVAQQVALNGQVGGSATAAGQQVVVGRQGTLGGGLLAAGQDVNLAGRVGRGVLAGASALRLGGVVGGDVQTWVDQLSVDPTARVGGQLRYTSANPAAVPAGVTGGGIAYQPSPRPAQQRAEPEAPPLHGLFGLFDLVWLAGSIVVAVLLVHFLPGFARGAVDQLRRHPLASFGLGLALLLLVPPGALLLALSLVGLPLALLAAAGYFTALYIGYLLLGLATGAALGALVRRRGAPARMPRLEWLVILGLVVLYVITHLPWVGGLATLAALCFGSGALLRQAGAWWRGSAAPTPAG